MQYLPKIAKKIKNFHLSRNCIVLLWVVLTSQGYQREAEDLSFPTDAKPPKSVGNFRSQDRLSAEKLAKVAETQALKKLFEKWNYKWPAIGQMTSVWAHTLRDGNLLVLEAKSCNDRNSQIWSECKCDLSLNDYLVQLGNMGRFGYDQFID